MQIFFFFLESEMNGLYMFSINVILKFVTKHPKIQETYLFTRGSFTKKIVFWHKAFYVETNGAWIVDCCPF